MTRAVIKAADLFCGAGGTTEGAELACQDEGVGLDIVGINHWRTACDTYERNHPHARVYCETLDGADPRRRVPGRLDLLMASPECTQHSPARGNKPFNDESRASGWHILRWAEVTRARRILIENVPAWEKWGPTGANGRPLTSRQGETFLALIQAIRALGYRRVEWRRLVAADYGDPTDRKRLFVIASRSNDPIEWPEPSHGPASSLLRHVKPWRTAREIIDWSIPGRSIYGRKKPLSDKTIARIAEGVRRFSGGAFVLPQHGGGAPRNISQPMPTVTTDGAVRVIEPVIVTLRNNGAPRSVDAPLTSIATSGNHHRLVEAFIASYYGTTNIRPISEPLPTITTRDRFALVEPVIVDGSMLDVRVRMLAVHELARATSLGEYVFTGNQSDQKKQIGNAVPRELARALCRSQIRSLTRGNARKSEEAA